MRLLLIALLALPLAGQVARIRPIEVKPTIREAPDARLTKGERADPAKVRAAWVAIEKRPTRRSDRTARRALRLRHCQPRRGGLIIGTRARYTDSRGVTWYVAAHPTFGVVAARDNRLLDELACSPVYRDGRHDRLEIEAYFADQIAAGTARVMKVVPDGWAAAEE